MTNYRIDYDLNIYRQEVEVPDQNLVDPTQGTVFEYQDPWRLDVFFWKNHSHFSHLDDEGAPFSVVLTAEESQALQLGSGYFEEDDNWYGLEGFLKDYEHQISDRLWDIFNALPTTKENN